MTRKLATTEERIGLSWKSNWKRREKKGETAGIPLASFGGSATRKRNICAARDVDSRRNAALTLRLIHRPLPLGLVLLHTLEHLQPAVAELDSVKLLDCAVGGHFTCEGGVPMTLAGDQVHVDQIAEPTERVLQQLYRNGFRHADEKGLLGALRILEAQNRLGRSERS